MRSIAADVDQVAAEGGQMQQAKAMCADDERLREQLEAAAAELARTMQDHIAALDAARASLSVQLAQVDRRLATGRLGELGARQARVGLGVGLQIELGREAQRLQRLDELAAPWLDVARTMPAPPARLDPRALDRVRQQLLAAPSSQRERMLQRSAEAGDPRVLFALLCPIGKHAAQFGIHTPADAARLVEVYQRRRWPQLDDLLHGLAMARAFVRGSIVRAAAAVRDATAAPPSAQVVALQQQRALERAAG